MPPLPALPHSGPHAPFSPLHVPVEAALPPALPCAHRSEPGASPRPHTPAQASSSESPLHPASKRLFSGRLHPVTLAATSLGLDCFEPFDLDGDTAHDILDDVVFEALLRLCWSGIVALIVLAPPCKEYSRLKLRPGGPKALRTPQYMDGVPGLSLSQRKKLLDSKTIHDRGRALFRAVVSKGGVGIWEQPPSAMSWLEEANFQMLRDHQCALVWVDACRRNKAFSKSWAFGCNSSKIRALEARCNHSYKHQSIAGVKEQGVYLSTLTAEYPPSLALQLAQEGSVKQAPSDKHCHCTPISPEPSHWRPAGSRPATVQEWCCPKPEHPLQAVARPWLHWMHERKLVPRILAHIKKRFSGWKWQL